jgi:hypothetical protein
VLGDRRLGQQLVEPGDQLPDDRPDGVDVRAVGGRERLEREHLGVTVDQMKLRAQVMHHPRDGKPLARLEVRTHRLPLVVTTAAAGAAKAAHVIEGL